MQSTSGPLITALPDDDSSMTNRPMSSQRPVIVLQDNNKKISTASQPIVTSPVSTQGPSFGRSPGQVLYSSGLPSYSHSSSSQPAYTTGVVTFPEDQPQQHQPPVILPTHIMEPVNYSEQQQQQQQTSARRAAGPIRQFSEEDIMDSRNYLGEHIDYISSNLDSLQQLLANQHTLFETPGLSEILTSNEGGNPGFSNLPSSQQDFLEAIAERAIPNQSQQSQELVQYAQGMGNPQRSLRQHELPSQVYGRKNIWTSQGNAPQDTQYEESEPRSHYEVQDLFNG